MLCTPSSARPSFLLVKSTPIRIMIRVLRSPNTIPMGPPTKPSMRVSSKIIRKSLRLFIPTAINMPSSLRRSKIAMSMLLMIPKRSAIMMIPSTSTSIMAIISSAKPNSGLTCFHDFKDRPLGNTSANSTVFSSVSTVSVNLTKTSCTRGAPKVCSKSS